MFFSSSLLVAALIGVAQAQTPEGFEPAADTKLEVMFNSTMVNTPGQPLSKAATANTPQIAAQSDLLDSSATYMFMMLDLDVPPAAGTSERRILLHAMTTGFKATQQQQQKTSSYSPSSSNPAMLLASPQKGPATYIGPSPPASDTMPHRYVELLFQQPDDLQVSASMFANTMSRIGFDVKEFMEENGLDEPLAGNFFTVDGSGGMGSMSASAGVATGSGVSGAGAGATATGSGGMPASTLSPFEGKSTKMEGSSLGLMGLVFGLAVMGA